MVFESLPQDAMTSECYHDDGMGFFCGVIRRQSGLSGRERMKRSLSWLVNKARSSLHSPGSHNTRLPSRLHGNVPWGHQELQMSFPQCIQKKANRQITVCGKTIEIYSRVSGWLHQQQISEDEHFFILQLTNCPLIVCTCSHLLIYTLRYILGKHTWCIVQTGEEWMESVCYTISASCSGFAPDPKLHFHPTSLRLSASVIFRAPQLWSV